MVGSPSLTMLYRVEASCACQRGTPVPDVRTEELPLEVEKLHQSSLQGWISVGISTDSLVALHLNYFRNADIPYQTQTYDELVPWRNTDMQSLEINLESRSVADTNIPY